MTGVGRIDAYEIININDELIIYGYPAQPQDINFDEKYIVGKLFVLKGFYGGNSDYEHIGIIENLNIDSIAFDSLNGLSGSPIYKTNNKFNRKVLVGILLRGTVESKKGYFIKSEVLKKTLIDIRNGNLTK